jgi:hypothetical protein
MFVCEVNNQASRAPTSPVEAMMAAKWPLPVRPTASAGQPLIIPHSASLFPILLFVDSRAGFPLSPALPDVIINARSKHFTRAVHFLLGLV